MEKKEFHWANLPHFQQSGQAYFVTWTLKDAVPPKALSDYTNKLASIRNQIKFASDQHKNTELISQLKYDYNILRKKFMKAYEDVLHLQHKSIVNLSKPENTRILIDALGFWENKRLHNYAICVMSNHIHWVFRLYEKDENGLPIYLQDILHSVKRFSSNKINKLESLTGSLWQKESWDTTIRDDKHLYNAIEYTKNNPVTAKLVKNWQDWKGTIIFE